eukprot:scaffold221634_cov18-Tisochrysis_lutea.AAC.1
MKKRCPTHRHTWSYPQACLTHKPYSQALPTGPTHGSYSQALLTGPTHLVLPTGTLGLNSVRPTIGEEREVEEDIIQDRASPLLPGVQHKAAKRYKLALTRRVDREKSTHSNLMHQRWHLSHAFMHIDWFLEQAFVHMSRPQ